MLQALGGSALDKKKLRLVQPDDDRSNVWRLNQFVQQERKREREMVEPTATTTSTRKITAI